MKKPITVKILVTVNDIAQFRACTLCFESLRVGWPTANIYVYVNGGAHYGDIADKLQSLNVLPVDLFSTKPIHLAEWIQEQVEQTYPGPLVIADPDIVYWKSCEDWEFNPKTLFAGYHHPRMWNDFSNCISVERIHTSMMVFTDTDKLAGKMRCAYPWAFQPHGEYCPCDPFMGRVMFEDGKPVFWDCCANLYNMLVHTPTRTGSVYHFDARQLECYDHLNSASFYACMCDRLQGDVREGFIAAHRQWVNNPTPGLWPLVDAYYKQKAIEAWVKQPGDQTLKV